MVAANARETESCAAIETTEENQEPRGGKHRKKTVDIYPYSTDLFSLAETGTYSKLQRVHIIRHAEGTHNVNHEYSDIRNLDARLTELGKLQCQDLAQKLKNNSPPSPATSRDEMEPQSRLLHHTELVVTSPLTRCIQTALLSFPTLANNPRRRIPIVAHEDIRETVNYACDRRRSISELTEFHSQIDFQTAVQHDHDELWESYVRRVPDDHTSALESAELHACAERARSFFTWLEQRKEVEVVVCTHSAFLRCFLSWGLPGGVPMQIPQFMDDRKVKHDVPVVQYCGDDKFEEYMRSTYDNCELRSCVVAHRMTM